MLEMIWWIGMPISYALATAIYAHGQGPGKWSRGTVDEGVLVGLIALGGSMIWPLVLSLATVLGVLASPFYVGKLLANKQQRHLLTEGGDLTQELAEIDQMLLEKP